MSAQNWRMRSTLRGWLDTRGGELTALISGYVCVMYALAIVLSLYSGDDSPVGAPWLNDDQGVGAFFVSFFLISFLGIEVALLHDLLRRRLALRSSKPRVRRDRTPLDDRAAARLALKWMFTGWRLCVTGPSAVLTFGSLVVVLLAPEMRGALWENLMGGAWLNSFAVALVTAWALLMKGRELRRGKEQIKVADEYLAMREERLHREYDAMCEKLIQQQQDWRSEKVAEVYAQILDQQARGLLPCPNCEGHRKSA